MRRHFVYAEQEHECSVGSDSRDPTTHATQNVLQLWLARRTRLQQDANVELLLVDLWDLAKQPATARHLSMSAYAAFFALVAKALVASVGVPEALAVAPRDWLYDCQGQAHGMLVEDDAKDEVDFTAEDAGQDDAEMMDPDDGEAPAPIGMALELFKAALFEIAELLLPVESEASQICAFLAALREAITMPASAELRNNNSDGEDAVETRRVMLAPLERVTKIRAPFLQDTPPDREHLALIADLMPPDAARMSLKQLLLGYNPRKLALSRHLSSLFEGNAGSSKPPGEVEAAATGKPAKAATEENAMVEETDDTNEAAPPLSAEWMNRHAERADRWDQDAALTQDATSEPTPILLVAGPIGSGKTRLATALAKRLGMACWSPAIAVAAALEQSRATTPPEDPSAVVEATEPRAETSPEPDQGHDQAKDKAEEDDRALRLTDADRDALLLGGVLSRATAIALLIAHVQRAIDSGMGVVLDDVRVDELPADWRVACVVHLELSRADTVANLETMAVAPSSRRLLSAREQSLLLDDADQQNARGFAAMLPPRVDNAPPPTKQKDNGPKEMTTEGDSDDADASPRQDPADEDKDASPTPESHDEEAEMDAEADLRHALTPGERPVSLRTLLHERCARVNLDATALTRLAAVPVIRVIAAQALRMQLVQCVHAVTNNALGLSRWTQSHRAFAINLPEAMRTSSDRAQQMRWLLSGDWRDSPPAALDPTAVLPVRTPRLLSAWRECCVVTSTPSSLVRGDPSCAAFCCGRVFLFSSDAARRAFCRCPRVFLQRAVPMQLASRNVLLLCSRTLDAAQRQAVQQALAPQTALVSAIDVLHEQVGMAVELMRGQVIEASAATTAVIDSPMFGLASAWVVCDLPPTRAVLGVMQARGCLPDVVLRLDCDPAVLVDEQARHKHALWAAKTETSSSNGSTELQETLAAFALPMCMATLFDDARATTASVQRALHPLAPRVDESSEGVCDLQDAAAVFPPPAAAAADTKATEDVKAAALPSWRMGESARYCCVTWAQRGLLVPGRPEFVRSFKQRWYAFASASAQRAFEQQPDAFVPTSPNATAALMPLVLLLGPRGAMADTITTALASTSKVVLLSLDAIAARVVALQRCEPLLPATQQTAPIMLYAKAVAQVLDETRQAATSSSTSTAIVIVLSGLGPSESRVPSVELLDAMRELAVMPQLVVPLSVSETSAVQRGLSAWREAQPTPKRKPRAHPDQEQEQDDPDQDEDAEPSREEQEAAQVQTLQEQHRADFEALAPSLQRLRDCGVEISPAVATDATATMRASVQRVRQQVERLLQRKSDALFQAAERVSLPEARRLLQSGEAMLGQHGLLDPVTGDTATSTTAAMSALLYRSQLYFPASNATLAMLEAQPSLCVSLPAQSPRHCATCCVVGHGQASIAVAESLANRFGLVLVSPDAAIDWVRACHGGTALWRALQEASTASSSSTAAATAPIDAALLHAAIWTRLRSAECQQRGWVLADYLKTPMQLQLCLQAAQRVTPAVVFLLEQDAQVAPTDDWRLHRLHLLDAWTSRFGAFHLQQLETRSVSAWHVAARAADALQAQIASSKRFRRDVLVQRVARLHRVVRPCAMLHAQQHAVFGTFCPVELAAGRYVTSAVNSRLLAVEFRGNVFWLASRRHLRRFAAAPLRFVDDAAIAQATAMRAQQPIDISLLALLSVPNCDFPALRGYCPVTLAEAEAEAQAEDMASKSDSHDGPSRGHVCTHTTQQGPPRAWRGVQRGSVFYRASFQRQVFLFASERARRRFLRAPTEFASLVLPVKLPPQIQVTLSRSYPGRLEQELSGVLNECLLVLGTQRPKLLRVTGASSACFYLALLLKLRSGAVMPHRRLRWQQQLQCFEQDAELRRVLHAALTASCATSCGPAIKGVRAVAKAESNAPVPTASASASGAGETLATQIARWDQLAIDAQPLRRMMDPLDDQEV